MTRLIDNLAAFNRKERFHLLSFALGIRQSAVKLHEGLRDELGRIVNFPIPPTVFLAMDYHLDWIAAALEITKRGEQVGEQKHQGRGVGPVFPRGKEGRVTGSQEDVDLLVACAMPGSQRTALIMIEAKSETSWGNTQLESKGRRLGAIFGDDNAEWRECVEPFFLLTSPREPERLVFDVLPTWAKRKRIWFPLEVGDTTGGIDLFQVVRCTQDGKDGADGEYWKIR